MWIWGEHYAKDDEEDRTAIYEGQMTLRSKPLMVKWLTEREMKVLDVASGYSNAIVKVQNKDGKILLYGFSQSSNNLSAIGGATSVTSAYKHYISEIQTDA
mgnify:CR=1 FL=1